MSNMSSTIVPLSDEQRAAHRGAHYHAATPRSMPLHVYEHSTELTQQMRKRFVQTAALMTAHNPAGKAQTPAKNKKANAALLARIEARGLSWLPGHRKSFKEGDPDEEGYLVFGITGGQLEALMEEFDQEVALWCPASGTPVLMLHPRARRHYSAAELAWERALREEQTTNKKGIKAVSETEIRRAPNKAAKTQKAAVANEAIAEVPPSLKPVKTRQSLTPTLSVEPPLSSRRKNSVKV